MGRPDFGGRWPRGEALGRKKGCALREVSSAPPDLDALLLESPAALDAPRESIAGALPIVAEKFGENGKSITVSPSESVSETVKSVPLHILKRETVNRQTPFAATMRLAAPRGMGAVSALPVPQCDGGGNTCAAGRHSLAPRAHEQCSYSAPCGADLSMQSE